MYEPEWRYPATAAEAAEILLDEGGEARVVAGATDLALHIRDGSARPRVLVDAGTIRDLPGVELRPEDDVVGRMEIGATVTHATLARHPLVLEHVPVLAAACRTVGSPQIRARGTIGGNLVNASPAADGAVALLALDAAAWVQSTSEHASDAAGLPLDRFFRGPGETVLRNDEFLGGVTFDCPSKSARSVYLKAGQRNALAIAIVSVAVIYEPDDGLVRIALGSVAPTPVRATVAEELFEEKWPATGDRETIIDAVASRAAASASPIDDVRSGAVYRRTLVESMTRTALRRLCLPQK
jgi:CO/xanthine dehydrogenase FAD-binding subunit